jgi:hypothetical protein
MAAELCGALTGSEFDMIRLVITGLVAIRIP